MVIHRLFQSKPFGPETISIMSGAYDDVCAALGVQDCDLPALDLVAKAVIEFAQRGINDRIILRQRVLEALAPA